MPRRARISLAKVPHHIIQRGKNRSAKEGQTTFYMSKIVKMAKGKT